MNKIYKVIWNKVRNCYVVVSEIAKRNSKGSAVTDCRRRFSSVLAAMVLASLLNLGVAAPVWAASEIHYIGINAAGSHTNFDGDGASGTEAIAIGADSSADGTSSIAIGFNAVVAKYYGAIAIGGDSSATGDHSLAIGYKAVADGLGAIAIGDSAASQGTNAVAFAGNKSYGDYSMSWGFNNIAGISADGTETYEGATAFGSGTEARNDGATAMGNMSIAEGPDSVAMGNQSHTHADAKASFAMGQESHTLGTGSFAGGTDSIAGGFNSFAHGYTAEAVGSTAIAMGDDAKAIGDESVALGYNSNAFGDYSVAILGGRTGNGTFTYDEDTEEYNVNVTNNAMGAIAAGFGSVAMKDYTVAIGRHATVNNDKGIALGEDALVSADESSALGYGSVATEENVISVGHKQGDPTYDGGTYSSALTRKIVNVANGVDDTDAATVGQLKENAVHYYQVNSTGTEAGSNYNNDGATGTDAIASGYKASASGNNSIAIGHNASAEGKNSVAIGTNANAKGEGSVAFGESSSKGTNSFAFGRGVASGIRATAWGGQITSGGVTKVSTASGSDATAFGVGTTASGSNSTSWGSGTVASATQSTAWGTATQASAYGATSFGNSTTAENNNATAFGMQTHAKGRQSTAFGQFTEANNFAATAFGYGIDENAMIRADGFGATAFGVAATRDTIARGTGATAFGYETHATEQMATAFGQRTQATGAQATAFGAGSIASGRNATAFGSQSIAGGLDSTAYGTKSVAFGDNSVAMLGGKVGEGTVTTNETTHVSTVTVTKNAIGALAAGDGAVASENYAYAIGQNAFASKENSIAIGNGAVSSDSTSLALGNGSAASTSNVISVGHKEEDLNYKGAAFGSELKRRIVNVADGTSATDAATVGQTVQLVDGTNTTIEEVGKNDIGQKKYKVNVTADGQVASEDTRLVTGDTVYQALASYTVDGVVKKNETKAVSGDTVYTEVRPSENGTYVQTTSTTGANLTALDGQVTANTQTIAGHTTDITNLKDLSNITDAGNEVIRSQAKLAINVKGADLATVTKTDENGIDTYTVSVKADGKVAAGNTSIVTGDTVYQAIQEATAGSTDKNAVKYDTAEKDKVTLAGNNGTVLDNVSEGTVSADSKQAVNGSQLYETNQNVADNTQKITDLGNQVGALETRVGTVSEGQYVSSSNSMGENINALDDQLKDVSEGLQGVQTDVTNMQTDITNLQNDAANKADKDLSNITDNGKEVIRNTVQPALDEKANVDASNIDGQAWADKLGTGKIVEGDNGLVKGATVYEALQSVQESALVEADGATGAIRIGAKPRYDSYSTVDVSNSRGGGRVITGVVTDPSNKMSAANVAYVDSIGENIINGVNGGFNRLNNRIDKVGAGAAAMASLAPLPYGADEKWSLSAGIGQYHGSTAAAVGAFFRPKDNILLNIRGTVGNDSNMLGAGITFALDKMQTSSPTKKQLINTVNAQAQKITEQEEKIAQQDARLAQQDARLAEQDAKIARLEALVNQAVSR